MVFIFENYRFNIVKNKDESKTQKNLELYKDTRTIIDQYILSLLNSRKQNHLKSQERIFEDLHNSSSHSLTGEFQIFLGVSNNNTRCLYFYDKKYIYTLENNILSKYTLFEGNREVEMNMNRYKEFINQIKKFRNENIYFLLFQPIYVLLLILKKDNIEITKNNIEIYSLNLIGSHIARLIIDNEICKSFRYETRKKMETLYENYNSFRHGKL